MTDYDNLEPQSVEAEEAVIGAVMVNPEVVYDLLPFVRPEQFFVQRLGWAWKAITRLVERKDPIDYLTVVEELEAMGKLRQMGGAAYVLSLINKTPSALNAEGYARIVERLATRRELLSAASKIARLAHSEDTEIDEVVSQAEAAVFDVTRKRQTSTGATAKGMMNAHYDRTVELMRQPDPMPGYPTGLVDLDRLLGGLQPGTVTVVAARPGMGKTVLGENIVRHNASKGIPAGLVSLEMGVEEMASRMIAAHAGLDLNRVRQARLDGAFEKYQDAVGWLADLPMVFEYPTRLTPQQLFSIGQRWVYEMGVRVVVVDYVQLMSAPGFGSSERVGEVSYIARMAKLMARELDVALVLLAQLNRECEKRSDKRPLLSDLKESGALEENADVVIFPFRPSYYDEHADEGLAEVNVAKHRNGPVGMVEVGWQGPYVRFVNIIKREVAL